MVKLITCPECHSQIDISSVPVGATVRCADCDGLLRIPTGSTGILTSIDIVPEEPRTRPPSGGGRQTDIFRKMSGARSPGGTRPPSRSAGHADTRRPPQAGGRGMLIGIAIAGAALIGIFAAVQSGKQRKEDPLPIASGKAARARQQREAAQQRAREREAEGEAPPAVPVPAPRKISANDDPEKMNWEEILKQLRSGGGFDDPDRPEGQTFARVQGMGRKAYPCIARLIDQEDVALGKTAVTVLNALTGRQGAMPTEATRTQVRTEWETWIKGN